jgi:hypothetical protein
MRGKGNLIKQLREATDIYLGLYNITPKAICIEQVLCMLACWVEDSNGDYFKKHIARIPDYICVAEDGIKLQVMNTHILQKQLHN